MGMMRHLGWFSSAALATGIIVGCAQRPSQRDPAPTATSPASAENTAAEHAATLAVRGDATLQALQSELSHEARARGLGPTVAFIWGDVTRVPGAEPVHITARGATLDGWLVGGAHEIDVGKLAPEIENIAIVHVDKRGLFASHPSGPGRHHIDLDGPHDAESDREARVVFAMIDVETGHDVRAENAVAWLSKLSGWVRYGVMALPDA